MGRLEELRKLLAAARNPGPWIRPWESTWIHAPGSDHVLRHQSNLDLAAGAVNTLPELLEIAEVAGRIAQLTESDIRDYEQGLCFFCGAGWEWVPGPRGGRAKRKHTKAHEPNCSYAALRAALENLR